MDADNHTEHSAEKPIGPGTQLNGIFEIDEKIAVALVRAARAEISPMAALVGGFAAQEVLKACSGKFTPLQQYWYFDANECLPDPATPLTEFEARNTRYDDQIAVFGTSLQTKLANAKYFLVGAGAIGCEMLKNWALMGVAAGTGHVYVTDMDNIERTNLNRQFLFRSSDLGQLKSITAAAAVSRMNPAIKITAQANRVGPESENVYNTEFWAATDAVITALDNVEARQYLDGRCVFFQKPMIDSGTLGTKGSTQVVVPFLTESYSSSRDPPEDGIPICTLKLYPNKIEHTIQWARELFEEHFKQAPEEVNKYLTNSQYLEQLAARQTNQLETLKAIQALLVKDRPLNFEECVCWARLMFEREFGNNIRQLLFAFPPDTLTKEGAKFWSGLKRVPTALDFDSNDETHMQFIIAAANLRAYNFGLKGDLNIDRIRKTLQTITVPKWSPARVFIPADDAEAKRREEEMKNSREDDVDAVIAGITSTLPAPSSLVGFQLQPINFEKDDDSNYHMDFITACSNLRARNYRIKEESKYQTKFIAGKIIPAIATTTALVTGFVCLEMVKLLQKKPVESFRNTFVNLALPLSTFSDPMPPSFKTVKLADRGEWRFSLWDRIELDIGDATLEELLNYCEKRLGLEVVMICYGSAMLFTFYGAKKPERKKMR